MSRHISTWMKSWCLYCPWKASLRRNTIYEAVCGVLVVSILDRSNHLFPPSTLWIFHLLCELLVAVDTRKINAQLELLIWLFVIPSSGPFGVKMDMIFSSQMFITDCLASLTECRRQPFNRLILVFPVLAGKLTNILIIPNHQPFRSASSFSVPRTMVPRSIIGLLDALFAGLRISSATSFCACCLLHVLSSQLFILSSLIHAFWKWLPPSWVWLYRCECRVIIIVSCSHSSFCDGLATNLQIRSFAR